MIDPTVAPLQSVSQPSTDVVIAVSKSPFANINEAAHNAVLFIACTGPKWAERLQRLETSSYASGAWLARAIASLYTIAILDCSGMTPKPALTIRSGSGVENAIAMAAATNMAP